MLTKQFIFDYGWTENKKLIVALIVINGFSSGGSCIGALIGGFLITSGRKRTIILANFLGALSIAVS